jgi:hypothetical protein
MLSDNSRQRLDEALVNVEMTSVAAMPAANMLAGADLFISGRSTSRHKAGPQFSD